MIDAVPGGFLSGELAIFPANGLDQSLHAPVLVGLVILTLFRESLGWGYAGLVVPGYLATVFLAAPLTGGLMVIEGLVGYFVSALIGRALPRTGAWSELFGRERFLLIILCALLTRLGMEAYWVPRLVARYGFAHSRELYSIGLVLVPLLANSFWNAGLFVSLPRVAVTTLVTLLFVDQVLLDHTNFTLSRFQIANESVSLAFLETPHAYIILALGAVLAARDNVLYGWDYNGILVPALLAVAWYEPTKLLTTVGEALLVLVLSKAVAGSRPFRAILMVGSRRMLLAYLVGFVVKWLLGFAVLRIAPNLQAIDYFGFGYLLPSLLAVKMWNTDKIGRVLMPTLQVSLTAFVLGTGLSIVLGILDPPKPPGNRSAPVEPGGLAAVELLLADSAPAPRDEPMPWGELTSMQQGLAAADAVFDERALERAFDFGLSPRLRLVRSEDGLVLVVPRVIDPDDDRTAPRVALRPRAKSRPWLVVVDSPAVGAPSVVVAAKVSEILGARALCVRSRLPVQRVLDDAFVRELAVRAGIEEILVVGETDGTAAISIVGLVPPGIPVSALEATLGVGLPARFRAVDPARAEYRNRPRLLLPRAAAEKAAAKILDAPEIESWPEPVRGALVLRARDLTSVLPGRFEQPSIEELRLFSATVGRALRELPRTEPSGYARAIAAAQRYHFARVGSGAGSPPAFALFEPAGDMRRGQATIVLVDRLTVSARTMLELPAPRYERGAFDATLTLGEALDANAFLIAGALPLAAPDHAADPRRAAGRKSYYQVLHESWLNEGDNVLSVHGVAPDAEVPRETIVAFQRPRSTPFSGPAWTAPIARMLRDSGFEMAVVDGTPELEVYSGALDPPMAYARRFAGDQMMLLWLSESARLLFTSQKTDAATPARLDFAKILPREDDVAGVAERVGRCLRGESFDCPKAQRDCALDRSVDALERYNELRNPLELYAGLRDAERCRSEVLRDRRSGQLWVLVAGASDAFLVPIRPGPVRPRRTPELGDLGRAVALGLATLRLGGLR